MLEITFDNCLCVLKVSLRDSDLPILFVTRSVSHGCPLPDFRSTFSHSYQGNRPCKNNGDDIYLGGKLSRSKCADVLLFE